MRVVLAGLCRTPVGALGGALSSLHATDLGAAVARAVLARTGMDPGELDEVIAGSGGQPVAEANIARQIALAAGVPVRVPAFSVQRNCASGFQAVTSAADAILAGRARAILALGAESMSQAPYLDYTGRFGQRLRHRELRDALWEGMTDRYSGLVMGETAELLAERFAVSRSEQDAYAVQSHRRAVAAVGSGAMEAEIVPVTVMRRTGPVEVTLDEGPLPSASPERLAALPPAFRAGGTVTAGNACPMNDAAAGCLVLSEDEARRRGIRWDAILVSYAYVGVEPREMGLGPVEAVPLALERAGLELADCDLVELNEAFAVQALVCERLLGLHPERTNVQGGALALGHPVGATGLRLLTTLAHALARRGGRFGLATLCVGGGMGAAIVIERTAEEG